MTINNKYDFGQMVFLVTDPEQKERMVTAIQVFAGGRLLYQLVHGENATWHYEYEISGTENVLKRVR